MSVRLCQMPFDKDRSSSTSVQLFRQMPFDKKDLSMPFKRGLRQFTVEEKLDAVRRVHDGDSKASVARLLGVPESTLRGWCKNEKKLSFSLENSPVNNAVTNADLSRSFNYNVPMMNWQAVDDDDDGGPSPSESKRARLETKEESLPINSLLSYFLDQPKLNIPGIDYTHTAPSNGSSYKTKSSWFWDWYKHSSNDSLELSPKAADNADQDANEPLSLVTSKPNLSITLTDISKLKEISNLNNNNESLEQSPLIEAMRHGEKFLNCLENCSDPNITTVQVLQVRTLLNNVRNAAQRKLSKQPNNPQSRRK